MTATVTLGDLAAAKRDGRKIVAIVAWDTPMAVIADRVGVDIVSVGDSVGVNLWGHRSPLQVTLTEMVVVAAAVRRGVRHALLSVDFPYGPLQRGVGAALRAAIRLVKEAGVDLVKLDAAGDHPETVAAIVRAGVPVWAQMGITPQRALRLGLDYTAMTWPGVTVPTALIDELVAEARRLEEAGAALIDFTNSGPAAGAAVAAAVAIPVLGGLGGGPWLDGRVRMAHAAIGYAAANIDTPAQTYANVARVSFEALTALVDDVRSGRQIRGGTAWPRP